MQPGRSVLAVLVTALVGGGCSPIGKDQVRSDMERLVGRAVEVRSLEIAEHRRLGKFGGRTECFADGALVTFTADLRARLAVSNFRTVPEFEATIQNLEAGKIRANPEELEQMAAMFRLAEMTPPSWKKLEVGQSFQVRPTFEYLQRCGQKEFAFSRALPGVTGP